MASAASRRYVQAIIEIAREGASFDAWQRDLQRLGEVIADPSLASGFGNPRVPVAKKKQVLDQYLVGVQPEVTNLAHLLVERNRTGIVPELVTLFDEAVLAERGIVMADVTTAEPIDAASEQVIREQLGRIVGKTIELRLHTDPEIIGGLVARIGDEVIDGSVQTRLRRLRARLQAR